MIYSYQMSISVYNARTLYVYIKYYWPIINLEKQKAIARPNTSDSMIESRTNKHMCLRKEMPNLAWILHSLFFWKCENNDLQTNLLIPTVGQFVVNNIAVLNFIENTGFPNIFSSWYLFRSVLIRVINFIRYF